LAISFEELLALETVWITLVFALLYYLGGRAERKGEAYTGFSLNLVPAFLLFTLGAAYLLTPQVAASRLFFFLGESLIISAATLLVFRSDNPRTATTAILLVVGVNVLNGLMTKLVLGGVVWGLDERGFLLNALQIGSTGSYNSIVSGFYQVPTIPQLLYTLSSITSLSLGVTLMVVSSVFIVLFQSIVYLITRYLTRDLRVAFVIQVFTLFVPRLDLVQSVIPETYSLILAALSILLIAKVVSHDSLSPIRDFVVAMVLYGAVVVTHPSGAILVLTFMILTAVVYSQRLSISRAGYRLEVSSAPSGYSLSVVLLAMTAVIAAAYWISIPGVEQVITKQLSGFLAAFSTVTSRAKPVGVSYTPLYTESGLQYTLPWAFPVAISAAYYLVMVIRRRSESWSRRDLIGAICFIGGALLIVGSLFLLIGSPTSNADRYLGSPGYLLVLVSLVAPVTFLFSRRGPKILVVAFLVLLLTMIAVGPSVPDISPDSHAAIFEPPTTSSVQFYGSTLAAYPPLSTVASEKNFQPPITLQALHEADGIVLYSVSYKNTRDLLGGISAGTIDIKSFPNVYFIVDSSYLPGFLHNGGSLSDIYMSSGNYFVAGAPTTQP
jgi:hypothetical protein